MITCTTQDRPTSRNLLQPVCLSVYTTHCVVHSAPYTDCTALVSTQRTGVCLSLREHISRTTRPIAIKCLWPGLGAAALAALQYGRVSCTSGFAGDVMLACTQWTGDSDTAGGNTGAGEPGIHDRLVSIVNAVMSTRPADVSALLYEEQHACLDSGTPPGENRHCIL